MAALQSRTLDDAMVLGMAANARFLEEFPFLRGLEAATKTKGGCGRCGGANRNQALAVNSAKAAIYNMSPEKKRTMLKLLNVKSLRVSFNDGNRVVTKVVQMAED